MYKFEIIPLICLTKNRGVDFDDPEYGFKEETKDFVKVSILKDEDQS